MGVISTMDGSCDYSGGGATVSQPPTPGLWPQPVMKSLYQNGVTRMSSTLPNTQQLRGSAGRASGPLIGALWELDRFSNVIKDHRADVGSMPDKNQQTNSAFPEQCRVEAARMLAKSETAPIDVPRF